MQGELVPSRDEFVERHKVRLEGEAVEHGVRLLQRGFPCETLSEVRARSLEDGGHQRQSWCRADLVKRGEQRAGMNNSVKPNRGGERRRARGCNWEDVPEAGARSGEGRLGRGWMSSV
jgi:hypothetical protein